jgi:hypothetical protein
MTCKTVEADSGVFTLGSELFLPLGSKGLADKQWL